MRGNNDSFDLNWAVYKGIWGSRCCVFRWGGYYQKWRQFGAYFWGLFAVTEHSLISLKLLWALGVRKSSVSLLVYFSCGLLWYCNGFDQSILLCNWVFFDFLKTDACYSLGMVLYRKWYAFGKFVLKTEVGLVQEFCFAIGDSFVSWKPISLLIEKGFVL